jgi:branched-chain amino acid transport system substrate-binding protein
MSKRQSTETYGALSRRDVVKLASGLVAAPAILRMIPANAQSAAIKVGMVSPTTGPIAAFGEADGFILAQVAKAVGPGIANNGKTYPVQVIAKDSQSSSSRAAEVASELILGEKVDLILAADTPDTTNPVADQAEANEVPCITTVAPWQPYFFGRKGDPKKGFDWTYHFFWGLEDVIAVFTTLWKSAPTNMNVGGLFPNDADGNAWGDPNLGFPKPLKAMGFNLLDPGRYQPLAPDFSAQISAFKKANVEIVTGVMIPPDFATFWSQAAQQGFKPRIATIGKALLFPSAVSAIGDRGDGLSSEIWWSPSHPFKSSLNGQTAKQLCEAYTAATGKPWTQPLGFKYGLFEVAIDALKRAKSPKDPKAILEAIVATNLNSIVGPISWGRGPVKNVSKTPLVGGQWTKTAGGYDLVICEDATAPEIPVGGKLRVLS